MLTSERGFTIETAGDIWLKGEGWDKDSVMAMRDLLYIQFNHEQILLC